MAEEKKTVAIKHRTAMPVRTVAVLVREGNDAGLQIEGESGTIGTAPDNAVRLTDTSVSGYHARFAALKEGIQISDFGSTNGTWVAGVRLERGLVPPDTRVQVGRTQLIVSAGAPQTVDLHDEDTLGRLRGSSPVMRRLMTEIRRVASSHVPVLLHGESGTGKELVARAIHDESERSNQPFVTVDCGSLLPNLVTSELFGHEQGAFTGAHKQKRGSFEAAHRGTLFLDEIGELAPDIQAMLLGALERRRFCRVGGTEEVSVDVRVVAATNRDLRTEVNAGNFRLDLYYRLAVVTLELAPLRERAADIPQLIEHFLREEGSDARVADVIPPATMRSLSRHRWPGNLRELRNFVQATLAMGEPMALRADGATGGDLGGSLGGALTSILALPYAEARRRLLDEFESQYLRTLMDRAHGNVARAAREAEMARSHLHDLIRRHSRGSET